MAEDVLADAALRRASGTRSSALGYSNFTGFRVKVNWILCEDIDWIHSRFSEIRGERGTSQESPRRFQGRGGDEDVVGVRRFGMAKNVLADAALRRPRGTSSSALGYSNFTGFRVNTIAFFARTFIWILLEIQ
jgi:hypothetical protein